MFGERLSRSSGENIAFGERLTVFGERLFLFGERLIVFGERLQK